MPEPVTLSIMLSRVSESSGVVHRLTARMVTATPMTPKAKLMG